MYYCYYVLYMCVIVLQCIIVVYTKMFMVHNLRQNIKVNCIFRVVSLFKNMIKYFLLSSYSTSFFINGANKYLSPSFTRGEILGGGRALGFFHSNLGLGTFCLLRGDGWVDSREHTHSYTFELILKLFVGCRFRLLCRQRATPDSFFLMPRTCILFHCVSLNIGVLRSIHSQAQHSLFKNRSIRFKHFIYQ